MNNIAEVQDAVRRLTGVAAAAVRWPDPLGPAMLRVEFAPGADEDEVTRAVLGALRDFGAGETQSIDLTLPAPGPAPATKDRARPVFEAMRVERLGLETRVEVSLEYAGRRLVGNAEGIASHQAATRTAAAAAIAALSTALPGDVKLQLDWLEVVPPGTYGRPEVVQAAVAVVDRAQEHVYVGSALVRGDIREAAVRATLDAVNRRVARLLTATGTPS